jgi:hypothetical protein
MKRLSQLLRPAHIQEIRHRQARSRILSCRRQHGPTVGVDLANSVSFIVHD